MTTINQELYEALKEAGASEDAAKRAAASVYDRDQLVSKMDLAVLDRHLARLGMIERVLWGIVIGVIALVVTPRAPSPRSAAKKERAQ